MPRNPVGRNAIAFTCLFIGIPHATTAMAQVTDANVATQSEDAFGTAVGSERIGLYRFDDIRGFSPVEAGNGRLDGLYVDLVNVVPPRLVTGSTIRVGIAAQRFPFPAPSGLVDYAVNQPEGAARLEISGENAGASATGPGGVAEFAVPLGNDKLSLGGGIGGRAANRPEGGSHLYLNYGLILSARPAADLRITAMFGRVINKDEEARATYFPTSNTLPDIPRGSFIGQPWAKKDERNFFQGVIAKWSEGTWAAEAGLFRSGREFRTFFSDLVQGVDPAGNAANRVVIADAGRRDVSVSGELRVMRRWTAGKSEHRLIASLRGRSRNRLFGGSQRIELGTSSAIVPDFRSAPALAIGAKNVDAVRQATLGLSYGLSIGTRLDFNGGISTSHYRKSIDFADPTLADPVRKTRPLLWNAALSLGMTKGVLFYVSATRGEEEAPIAPENALNRAEAPPSIHTRQWDVGLRFALADRMKLVVGAFSITKPYYNLAPDRRYRELGDLANRGLELSLTAEPAKGLHIVAGGLIARPRISGEAVASGLIGERPVGQPERRFILEADWRLQGGKSPLSFEMGIDHVSSRPGNAANSLSAPGFSIVTLGARYRFEAGGARWIIRPQIDNLFDTYGWQVAPNGGYTYVRGRTAMIELSMQL